MSGPAKSKQTTKPYTYQELICLLAALQKRGVKIGNADYQAMAEYDGTRTASAYDHLFRPAKQQANELVNKGSGTPAATPRKRVAKNTAVKSSAKKQKTGVKETSTVKSEASDDGNEFYDF